MSIEESIEVELASILRVVLMTVGKEKSLPFIHNQGIICHDGEVEEHLIDFAVTVSSDGDDVVRKCIELLGYSLRIVAFGDTISRAEIEEIAKKQEHVALLAMEVSDNLVKCGFGTVDIGGNEVFHIYSVSYLSCSLKKLEMRVKRW